MVQNVELLFLIFLLPTKIKNYHLTPKFTPQLNALKFILLNILIKKSNYSKTPIYRAPIYRKPRYTAAISFPPNCP